MRLRYCFNSVQTGRCIQSLTHNHQNNAGAFEFQFRSNGKVYPKTQTTADMIMILLMSFNSLQTGRCIQSCGRTATTRRLGFVSIPFKREGVSKERYPQRWKCPSHPRFNSLQTGRCIQSLSTNTVSRLRIVSIPFKREGVSKGRPENSTSRTTHIVSIPFKREGVSKESHWVSGSQTPQGFNSLQTGRCIQSQSAPAAMYGGKISSSSFNSLQTGRCIQSSVGSGSRDHAEEMFQFPSNGKVYPKVRYQRNMKTGLIMS